MGTTDISQVKAAGDVVDETWYNDHRSALIGAFVGRDGGTGVVAAGQDLGTAIYPWGNLYCGGLVINGTAIDFDNLSSTANAIISGRVRSTSAFPDFIRANGAAASLQVLGASTNLKLNINNTAATVAIDITKSALTTAPTSNNTATVNDGSLAGAIATKWQGEDGTVITIASAGSEITSRVGQYCAFKVSTEYFLAYIESATQLTNAYRGCMFDSSGLPVGRVAISNGNTISIMSTAWLFAEDDGVTVDITYNSPIFSDTAPGTPATGDYWYDRPNETWKRYNGSSFVVINRILIGVAVIDDTNCVGSRSFNFTKNFESFNTVKLQYVSSTVVKARNYDFDLNVYGDVVSNRLTKYQWDITANLESGQVEASSTPYYAYITETGLPVLSNIKPYDQRGDLMGWYHPYNSWRCIGSITNDGSSNFSSTTVAHYGLGTAAYLDVGTAANQIVQLDSSAKLPEVDGSQLTNLNISQLTYANQQTFTGSGTWTKPAYGTYAKVQVWGGGGGGGISGGTGSGGGGGSYKEYVFLLSALGSTETVTVGAGGAGATSSTGSNGGASSFGSHITAYGGSGGGASNGGAAGGNFATATAGTAYNDTANGDSARISEGRGAVSSGSVTPTGGTFIGGGGGYDLGAILKGGDSIYGGGGGGIDFGGTAGKSVFGGNGGVSSGAGVAPAGGGSGNNSNPAGAGARGEVRVITW